MEHIRFIKKPSLVFYPGIRVESDTVLEFKTDTISQKLENLVFKSVKTVSGDGYDGEYSATIYLEPGDILVYDGEDRGYVKPVESFVTISQAVAELELVKDLE